MKTMNITHFKKVLMGAMFLVVASSSVFASETDNQIKDKIIQQSISSYSGSCPCPEFTDRAGRRCGRRSAYSRPGGASPLCYRSDVTDEMMKKYKARNK